MAIKSYEKGGNKFYDVYIHIRGRKNPKIRIQKRKTKIDSLNLAQKYEKTMLRNAEREIAERESKCLSWGEVIDKWEQENFQSPNYSNYYIVKEYAAMLRRWTPKWQLIPSNELNKGDGRKAIEYALKSGKSQGFVKKIKNTINLVYNWGIEERLIKDAHCSPVYGIKIDCKEEKFPEILNLEEIKALLHEAKRRKNKWYPIWAMALLTGMRSGELYALEWKDVDLKNKLIRVRKSFNKKTGGIKSTKTGYWRNVPISKDLARLLNSLIKTRKKERFVLPHYRYWEIGMQSLPLRAFLRELGLPSVRFHTLRACFATQLLSNGVELSKVMKIGGWRDLKTIQIYLRLAGVDEKGSTDTLKFLSH